MHMAPQRAHQAEIAHNAVVQDETETFSSAFYLTYTPRGAGEKSGPTGDVGSKLRPAMIGVEVHVKANSAGTTDNLECKVYGQFNGPRTGAVRNTVPAIARIIDCTSGADIHDSFWVDWKDVMSGFVIGIVATGSTDDITTTVQFCRYRMGNPATT